MNKERIPRILTPLFLAAAIVASMRYQKTTSTVELPASDEPARPLAEVETAYQSAFSAGAPGYEWGSRKAPVTVLELSDFGCMYCGKFARETYPQLAAEFINTGKVRFKYVPFVLGMFPHGREAARTGECAAEQGLNEFHRMHDVLFAQQDAWKTATDPHAKFAELAEAAHLNHDRFAACYGGKAVELRIDASNRLADQLGVRVTPTFFVNGARVEGALPIEEFRSVLNEAAAAAKAK